MNLDVKHREKENLMFPVQFRGQTLQWSGSISKCHSNHDRLVHIFWESLCNRVWLILYWTSISSLPNGWMGEWNNYWKNLCMKETHNEFLTFGWVSQTSFKLGFFSQLLIFLIWLMLIFFFRLMSFQKNFHTF